jgi:hypothetical protein
MQIVIAQHNERNLNMPRNGKEGILFSFIMSAIMIYVMAALNYGSALRRDRARDRRQGRLESGRPAARSET